MLQLQAVKHPDWNQPNPHFSSPPPRRGATAIALNTDAIESAPESLREINLGLIFSRTSEQGLYTMTH